MLLGQPRGHPPRVCNTSWRRAWTWRMRHFQSIKGLEYEMRLWNTLAEALEGTEYSPLE